MPRPLTRPPGPRRDPVFPPARRLLAACIAVLLAVGTGVPDDAQADRAGDVAPADTVLTPEPPVRLPLRRMPAITVELAELPRVALPPDSLLVPPPLLEAFAEAAADDWQLFQKGVASYYGRRFAGRLTASGERFDPGRFTAAHPSLPFGTRVRVTNLRNGESVVVRINDRGPYAGRRIIDLSRAAAQALGMLRSGTAVVEVEVAPPDPQDAGGE